MTTEEDAMSDAVLANRILNDIEAHPSKMIENAFVVVFCQSGNAVREAMPRVLDKLDARIAAGRYSEERRLGFMELSSSLTRIIALDKLFRSGVNFGKCAADKRRHAVETIIELMRRVTIQAANMLAEHFAFHDRKTDRLLLDALMAEATASYEDDPKCERWLRLYKSQKLRVLYEWHLVRFDKLAFQYDNFQSAPQNVKSDAATMFTNYIVDMADIEDAAIVALLEQFFNRFEAIVPEIVEAIRRQRVNNSAPDHFARLMKISSGLIAKVNLENECMDMEVEMVRSPERIALLRPTYFDKTLSLLLLVNDDDKRTQELFEFIGHDRERAMGLRVVIQTRLATDTSDGAVLNALLNIVRLTEQHF